MKSQLGAQLQHLVSRSYWDAQADKNGAGVHVGAEFVTLAQMTRALGMDPARSGPQIDRDIAAWLEAQGWQRVKRRLCGTTAWGYQRPGSALDLAQEDERRLSALLSDAQAAGRDFITASEALRAVGVGAATPESITWQSVRQWMLTQGWQPTFRRGFDGAAWGFVAPKRRNDGSELIGGRWIRRCYLDELAQVTGWSEDRLLASLPLHSGQRLDTRGPAPEPLPSLGTPALAGLLAVGVAALAIARTILRRRPRCRADAGQQQPVARGRAAQ